MRFYHVVFENQDTIPKSRPNDKQTINPSLTEELIKPFQGEKSEFIVVGNKHTKQMLMNLARVTSNQSQLHHSSIKYILSRDFQ